jgi:hypothetical protein
MQVEWGTGSLSESILAMFILSVSSVDVASAESDVPDQAVML